MRQPLFSRINEFLNKPIRNKSLRYGLPFFVFISLGVVLLSQVGTVRYQFRSCQPLDREEMKRLGIKMKERPSTLEEAYEKYQKMDIDNWENIRGPRLWDETPTN